jgi:RNA polymerase sigma-70 factor (family 1)
MHDKIVIEFQQGNKEAYRSIFTMLYPVMCLFAKKFINDYDDSEDIVQEVFIELWNQQAKFDSIEQIKAFLYLSIKNRCLNFIKHKAVKEKYSKTSLLEQEQHFEEYVVEVDVIQHLNDAINNLSEQRKLIMQFSMQGLANNEIAENMQISINTVKLYKKIAYKELREKLGSSPFLLLLLNEIFMKMTI